MPLSPRASRKSVLLAALSYWRLARVLLSSPLPMAAQTRCVWPWASLAAPSIGVRSRSWGIRVFSRFAAARRPGDVGNCSRGADPNIGWACYCIGWFLLCVCSAPCSSPGFPTSARCRYWRHIGWLAWFGVLAIWRVRQLSRGCVGDGLASRHRPEPVRRWVRLVVKERGSVAWRRCAGVNQICTTGSL